MSRDAQALDKRDKIFSSIRKVMLAMKGSLIQAVALSSLVQAQVILMPLFAGIIVDDVIPISDMPLLYTVTASFGIILVLTSLATLSRSHVITRVGSTVWWHLSTAAFKSTINLPLRWFHSRPQAAVLQVFSAVDQMRLMIAGIVTAVVVDGLLVFVSLIMLLFVSPTIAAISVLLLLTYIGIRLLGIPIVRRRQAAAIDASIKESSHRMEAVRAIQTIRALGGEGAKEIAWTNSLADSIRAAAAVSYTSSAFSSLQSMAMQLIGVATYFSAALLVMKGDISVGAMIAAIAYQSQFTQRASFLFEQYASWKNMDAHRDRIEEVFRATPEANGFHVPGEVKGILRATGLCFRYGNQDAPVLEDVDFVAHPGEVIAIVGPSGVGKTTLSKIIAGLYEPDQGHVLLDDVPLKNWDRQSLRKAVGVVLQDDEIFAGTIEQNVCFFAEAPSKVAIWDALDLAGLSDEVRRFPQREQTQVGEMGGLLSGGQRQRLQLARLFFRNPRVMILDEATAHLDVENEARILQSIRASGALVFLIAHRPETIRSADRVLRVNGTGGVNEIEPLDAERQLENKPACHASA